MIVVAQRVLEARVEVAERTVGAIGPGLCLLTCAVAGDAAAEVLWLADKLADLRIFADEHGKTNRSLLEVGGAVLLVPQFTLAADWRKGRRPSFVRAAAPSAAGELMEVLGGRLEARGLSVARGHFGARMRVHLINDGPFTLVLDSTQRPSAGPSRGPPPPAR